MSIECVLTRILTFHCLILDPATRNRRDLNLKNEKNS